MTTTDTGTAKAARRGAVSVNRGAFARIAGAVVGATVLVGAPILTLVGPLLATTVALAGIGLGTAATGSASEQDFINAIDSLEYYAIDCPGCAQDALDVGYRVCKAFDRGGDTAAIQEVLRSYNGPGQSNPDYHATLFAQYSAYELCPQHNGEIGPI